MDHLLGAASVGLADHPRTDHFADRRADRRTHLVPDHLGAVAFAIAGADHRRTNCTNHCRAVLVRADPGADTGAGHARADRTADTNALIARPVGCPSQLRAHRAAVAVAVAGADRRTNRTTDR